MDYYVNIRNLSFPFRGRQWLVPRSIPLRSAGRKRDAEVFDGAFIGDQASGRARQVWNKSRGDAFVNRDSVPKVDNKNQKCPINKG